MLRDNNIGTMPIWVIHHIYRVLDYVLTTMVLWAYGLLQDLAYLHQGVYIVHFGAISLELLARTLPNPVDPYVCACVSIYIYIYISLSLSIYIYIYISILSLRIIKWDLIASYFGVIINGTWTFPFTFTEALEKLSTCSLRASSVDNNWKKASPS